MVKSLSKNPNVSWECITEIYSGLGWGTYLANQRIAEIGRDLWRSYSPTSLLKAKQAGSVSSHILNKYGDSIASLRCLFQCSNTFIVKKSFFLCLHGIGCTSICAHVPLVLSLTKAWFCLFYLPPSTQVFTYIYHTSPGPSLLAKQSQISQPPKLQMLQSLHHLHGLSLSLFQCVHVSLIL